MTAWLSEEWLKQSDELRDGLPTRTDASGTVQVVVSGAPGGDVKYFRSFVEGRVSASGLGVVADAGVNLSVTAADAAEMVRGALEPSVAFMQGRLKATGDMATLLAILASTATADFRDAQERISAVTDL